MLKYFTLLLLCMISLGGVKSQTKVIKGTIYDSSSSMPIAGATIKTNSTPALSISDNEGNFSVTVPSSTKFLSISMLGYKPLEYPVNSNENSVRIDAKSRYEGFSTLLTQESKMKLMNASEVWFMKAEAALRGWTNAGDAKTNYETGILRSFEHYGISSLANAYMNNSTNKMASYIDPKSLVAGQNNVPIGSSLLSDITIQWNEADSKNKKLERIITQKWIAIFPDGDEAWVDYRRTGYPKLFPNIVNL